MAKPGKERVALTGNLTVGANSVAVSLVRELGSKARIDWTTGPAKTLTVDSSRKDVDTSLTESDKELIESLLEDTAESALERTSGGAGVSLIGRRFPDPEGGRCDLLDIFPTNKATRRPVVKRYCFDSATGLLRYVEYDNGDGTRIRTQFSEWTTVDGQKVPLHTVRTKGATTQFVFQAQSANVSPRANDSIFQKK